MADTSERLRASDARMIELAIDDQKRIFPDLEPGESGALAAFRVGRMAVRGHVYFSAWDGTEPEADELARVTVCSLDSDYEGATNMLNYNQLKVVAEKLELRTVDEELIVEPDDLDVFLRRMIAVSLIHLDTILGGVI